MRANAISVYISLLIAPVVLAACSPPSFTRKVVEFEDGSSGEVEIYKASEKYDFTKNAIAKYDGGEFSPNNYAFTSKLLMSFYQNEGFGSNSQPDVPGSRSMNLGFLMELGQSYGMLPGRSILGKGGGWGSNIARLGSTRFSSRAL